MKINERRVALRGGTTNFSTLYDYLNARDVAPLPFNETAVVTASGVNVVLIDSTMTVATKLAIGTGTAENGGLFATLLPGAVGTGATSSTSDSLGNILNAVPIRDATTHQSITEAGGKEVFALVQAVSTAVDGDSIGGSGSENTQLSFVYIAANGTITLTAVTATVEFGQKNVYVKRQRPAIMQVGGNPDAEAIAGAGTSVDAGFYVVTTAFAAGEVITLSDGTGASSGVATKSGSTIPLGATAGAFNSNNLLQVLSDGLDEIKGEDVIWDSSGSLHFALALDVGDRFVIRLFA